MTSNRKTVFSLARVTVAAALFGAASSGCNALTQVAAIGPILAIDAARQAALDALVPASVAAEAGETVLITPGQIIILDASASLVRGGSGLALSPQPDITFFWSVVDGPMGDFDGDGDIDSADLAAAGGRLDLAETAFPQFSATMEGAFTLQLTSTTTTPAGDIITGTDVVDVIVFDAVP